jgi:hypothetical protein
MTKRRRRAHQNQRVGDLGCLGVDTDEWAASNRCPMFPGMTNRWVLLRTLRDRADDTFVRQSLQAVLAKWLERITGWDPVGEYVGHTRVGPADNIKVLSIVRGRIEPSQLPDDWRDAYRREQLRHPPLPTLTGGDYCSLLVEFDWRSQVADIPWPIWTGGAVALTSTRHCPVDCDWMLDRAGIALRQSPPEVPLGEQVEEAVSRAGAAAIRSVSLPLVVGGVLLGLLAIVLAKLS